MAVEFEAVAVEDVERNSQIWKCCLFGTSDRNCVRFITIAAFSFFIIGFSASMLAFADLPCAEQNTFVGLITLILGFWLKSPLD